VMTYSDQWHAQEKLASKSPGRRLMSTARKSFAYQFGHAALRHGIGGIASQGAEQMVEFDSPGWTNNMQALTRIRELCDRAEIPLAIFHFRWNPTPFNDRYLTSIREAAAPYPVLDSAPWFASAPLREWVNSQTDSHPNAKAHARMASGIVNALREQTLIPFLE